MKRVRLLPHDSTTSRESIELDEYSDEEEEEEDEEEDEVFLGNRGRSSKNGVGGKGKGKSSRERIDSDKKPLMKKKVRIAFFKKMSGETELFFATGKIACSRAFFKGRHCPNYFTASLEQMFSFIFPFQNAAETERQVGLLVLVLWLDPDPLLPPALLPLRAPMLDPDGLQVRPRRHGHHRPRRQLHQQPRPPQRLQEVGVVGRVFVVVVGLLFGL